MRATIHWPRLIFRLLWCYLLFCMEYYLFLLLPPAAAPAPTVMPPWFRWLFLLAVNLLCLIFIFAILRRPTNRSSNVSLLGIWFLLAFLLCIGAYPLAAATGAIAPRIRLGFLFGLIALVFAQILSIYRTAQNRSGYAQQQLEQHKVSALASASVTALAVLGLTLWVPEMWGFSMPVVQLEGDLFGYYGAQLSLTFITISVMSVLSDKSMVVYWENIAEARLIRPVFGSFAAYTAYSITATVGSGISVILHNHLGFLVFFVANILILIMLTWAMVDVYFGREDKKRRLEQELREDAAGYQEKQRYFLRPGITLVYQRRARKTENDRGSTLYYKDKMRRLEYHLHQELEAHNVPYIREVAQLYGRNADCFRWPEGQEVEALLLGDDPDCWEGVLEGLQSLVRETEHLQMEQPDPITSGSWRYGEDIWYYLSRSRHLQEWIKANAAHQLELSWLVIRRLAVLYNDFAISTYRPTTLLEKLSTVSRYDDMLHSEFSETEVHKNLSDHFSEVVKAEGLLDGLAHLTLLLLETGDLPLKKSLTEAPLIRQLAPYLKDLGFNEDEIRRWQNVVE